MSDNLRNESRLFLLQFGFTLVADLASHWLPILYHIGCFFEINYD